ncbi:MAG: very short patch repair endonuclease [Chloroflexota bacterium]
MSDNLKPDDRKRTMQAVKSKGTRLEKRLFATLSGMGISGWKKNASNITGKPDIAFLIQKIAIFVDGCFWHGCPHCKRKLPKTNREYWERKIKRNIELAEIYNAQLNREGWKVIRIWEHEIRDKGTLKLRLKELKNELVAARKS